MKDFWADHLWMDCGNENNRITQNLFLDGIEQREAVQKSGQGNGSTLTPENRTGGLYESASDKNRKQKI